MRQRKRLAAMLVLLFASSGLSGCLGDEGLNLLPEKKGVPGGLVPVSYTHLTLPTILPV